MLMRKCSTALFVTLLASFLQWTVQAAVVEIEVTSWGGGGRDEAVVDAFNAANPDIHATYREVVGTGDALLVPVLAGEGPDVMTVSWAAIGDYMKNGLVEDLTPYIKADAQEIRLDDIFPTALASGKWNGIQYSLVNNIGAQGLYINNDIFAQAGLATPNKNWTWEDFAKIAKRLTKVDSTGKKVQWGWNYTTDYAPWMTVVFAYGGSILTPGFEKPAFNTPASVNAFKLLQQMGFQDGVMGGNFLQNNAAMSIRPSAPGDAIKFSWQPFFVPQGPNGGRALMGGAQQGAINKNSKNKAAAWRFLKFWTGRAGQTVAAEFGYVPFRQSLFRFAIEKNPELTVMVNQMDYWRQYTNRKHADINKVWTPVMKQLYAGQISPDAAVQTINDGIAAFWE